MPYKTSKDVDRLRDLLAKEDFIYLYSDDIDGKVFRGRDDSNCYYIQLGDDEFIYYGIQECLDAFISFGIWFVDVENWETGK